MGRKTHSPVDLTATGLFLTFFYFKITFFDFISQIDVIDINKRNCVVVSRNEWNELHDNNTGCWVKRDNPWY